MLQVGNYDDDIIDITAFAGDDYSLIYFMKLVMNHPSLAPPATCFMLEEKIKLDQIIVYRIDEHGHVS